MSSDADLEIGLSWDRRRESIYSYLRLDREGTSTDEWEQPQEPVALDLQRLRDLEPDDAGYGAALAEMLLRPKDIGPFYKQARASTQGEGLSLHVRLHINGPSQLHAVRWETLLDPDTKLRIATQSGVRFSRYLSSVDWRPIPARPQHALRGLAMVSAPTNIGEYQPNGRKLAEVDVAGELDRARVALADLNEPLELADGQAGLMPLLRALDEGIDVLYLVCHGALSGDVPQLYLERADRTVDLVDGRVLVERLAELEQRPTVVVLCSCQSATRGNELWTADHGELSALGPRLAAAGVAAVVAMQGDISMSSAERLFPKFFSELKEHGEVDRAMAVARREIGDQPDWWTPVLFSRLRSGRTYYKPEFTKRAEDTWRTLSDAMAVGRLTPVLGPGLADGILGSRQDMAGRWVERWQMPLATQTRGDLAQVAQYLRVRNTDGAVRAQLLRHAATEISNRIDNAQDKDDPFWGLKTDASNLEPTILKIGERLRNSRDDPYRIAAAMPVSVYVTTGWTNLLQEALAAVDRKPNEMRFRWNDPIDPPSRAGMPEPTVERPLVYHLFGHLDEVDSLVLTEDDYFAWFSAWLQKQKDIPAVVKGALVKTSLLFLGFRLDDWDFRVVFQAIKSLPGSALLRKNQHAGVQFSPESPHIEPEAVQEYLESYFGDDKVDIYWGETAGFLTKFRDWAGLDV